jgi:hypothetical protein
MNLHRIASHVIAPCVVLGLVVGSGVASAAPRPVKKIKPVPSKAVAKSTAKLPANAAELDAWWSSKLATSAPGSKVKVAFAIDSTARECVNTAFAAAVTPARAVAAKKTTTPLNKVEAAAVSKAMVDCGAATAWMQRELEVTYGLPATMRTCLMGQVSKNSSMVQGLLLALFLPNDPSSSKAQGEAMAAAAACITPEQIQALVDSNTPKPSVAPAG